MNTTSTRGRTFTGTVISDKMSRTVTVEWTRRHYIPKYERYEKRRTRVKAHNPDDIDAQVGDIVTIKETRPLSKTKHFTVIKKHADAADPEKAAAEAEKEENKLAEKDIGSKKTAEEKPKKTVKKKTAAKKKTTSKKESDDS